MPYYKENTLFKTKNNRLHIFQRKDAKTNNWYGRTFIEGKQTQTSSNTADKSKAIIILEQWFDRLHFKKSEGIQVHAKTDGVADNILEQEFYDAYGRQMDFYFWLFKKNKFKVANYGYFMFCNGLKTKEDFNKQMDFEYKLIKYEHKTDWIDDKVKEMKECMLSDKMPVANENCNFCTYSNSVNKYYKR